MNNGSVYLAYEYEMYECPCVPIKVFADRDAADAFAKACAAFDETRPRVARSDSDRAYRAWMKRVEAWSMNHPNSERHGSTSSGPSGGYAVQELPFIAKEQT